MGGLVVAGVDGSTSSLAAVEVAAREAQSRGVGLRLVHAYLWPAMALPLGAPAMGPSEGGLREVAVRVVDEARERATAVAPEVQVSRTVVTGDPLTVLESQSRLADLVVVGSRGMGGFVGLMVGSTAVHLTARAQCPVLVVREPGDEAGAVVLGVDGSGAAARAVDFAFTEAALRGAGVRAVHCWTTWNAPTPPPRDVSMPYANEPGALAASAERLLSQALAGRQERFPDVAVERQVVHGGTREALIEASRTARLLVVGARGRGGFTGLLLGSVSQAMLHHAHCPVAVVRG
ncbi:universal stress protein [Streptomyces buecherae]|uniref:Universal stress protein n=1 Tax=Streptomyces buecherae TaxID=2763006 RepID=A0A7H8N296_9ACTN|nr:universal stress protein [Streptomyces buecherae]QKW48627.1 universal stress protein [Streptomyces buecherae]